MQALGNVLAVPFETGPGSKVVFYDLSDPEQPVRLANVVNHTPLSDEAETATLGKLANGHFPLIIRRSNANTLDFYVSTGTDLRTTGYAWFDTWHEDELTGDDSEFGNYQNLSFVAGCDGTLFLVGTHRSFVGGFGDDFVDLFTVTNAGDDVAIHKVAKKQLICRATVISTLPAGYTSIPAGSCTYTERRTTMTECPRTDGETSRSPFPTWNVRDRLAARSSLSFAPFRMVRARRSRTPGSSCTVIAALAVAV
jgi:hypothetical protein